MRTGRPPPSKIFPWRAKRLLQKMLSRGEPNVGEEKRCEGRKTMLRKAQATKKTEINILEQIFVPFLQIVEVVADKFPLSLEIQ